MSGSVLAHNDCHGGAEGGRYHRRGPRGLDANDILGVS